MERLLWLLEWLTPYSIHCGLTLVGAPASPRAVRSLGLRSVGRCCATWRSAAVCSLQCCLMWRCRRQCLHLQAQQLLGGHACRRLGSSACLCFHFCCVACLLRLTQFLFLTHCSSHLPARRRLVLGPVWRRRLAGAKHSGGGGAGGAGAVHVRRGGRGQDDADGSAG